MSSEIQTAKEAWSEWAREWQPEFIHDDGGQWSARLPFRQVYAQGATKEEALAGLTRIYAQLAREGAFNPKFPHRVGAPPIQHVIEILEELLAHHTLCRFDDWTENVLTEAPGAQTSAGGRYTQDPRFTRRNEVISGLATAIAALARVKEL